MVRNGQEAVSSIGGGGEGMGGGGECLERGWQTLGEAEFKLAGKMGTKNESKNEEFCKMGGGGPFCKKVTFLASFSSLILEFQMKNELKMRSKMSQK
jgi:hypothetical protein